MIDTVVIQPGADTGEPSVAGVSWAAVAADRLHVLQREQLVVSESAP
jgi:hypothetical protein